MSGFATVSSKPDIRLFYTVSPNKLPLDPTRPTLVISNSLAAGTALWDDFAAEFSTTHNVIRYDARFTGQSPVSSTPDEIDFDKTTIDDLADDVLTVLDQVGAPKPVAAFIGLSIGGGIGVSLAARYPSRFQRFIIVGTRAHASLDGSDEARFAARAALLRRDPQKQAAESVDRWFGEEWIASHPDRAAEIASIVGATPVEGFLAGAGALKKLDLRDHAETIRDQKNGRRLLFVAGSGDAQAVRDESKALAQTVGETAYREVAGAGHIVHVQQAAAFSELVRQWIED